MVLEMLMNPRKAEKSPWKMIFIGAFYASIAILISMWIFEEYVGMIMVFLVVLASIHVVHGTLSYEEKKDMTGRKEVWLLKEHSKALLFLMFLFGGFVIAFSLWYIFLPPEVATNVFSPQIDTISAVNAKVVGFDFFGKVLMNNLKVLFFCVLFSFFYGTGALFILSWNASVVGAAIGNVVRSKVASITAGVGLDSLGSYFSAYSFGMMKYMTHGFFEIAAYFVAALGAGIIAIAVSRHDFGSKKFYNVLADSTDLLMISVALLVIAALIETYVTPVFF